MTYLKEINFYDLFLRVYFWRGLYFANFVFLSKSTKSFVHKLGIFALSAKIKRAKFLSKSLFDVVSLLNNI